MKKDRNYWIKQAARAHTDLNIFAAIVAMLVGGTVSADDFRVIKLCQDAQAKCLRRMDAAVAKAGVGADLIG